MRRAALLFALVALAAALAEPVFAQCSMCRAVVAQSPEGQRIGAQLNGAILLLVCAPYLVAGSVAAVLFRARIARLLARLVRLLLLR